MKSLSSIGGAAIFTRMFLLWASSAAILFAVSSGVATMTSRGASPYSAVKAAIAPAVYFAATWENVPAAAAAASPSVRAGK